MTLGSVKDLQRRKAELTKSLPHLFAFKHYPWSRLFFESQNRMTLLTAANQIGKSTVQIRKCITWATDTSLWPKLWAPNKPPRQFWYLYPSGPLATAEFRLKWIPELMPKIGQKIPATMKPSDRPAAYYILDKGKEECNDPTFGWKAYYDNKMVHYVKFASGLELHFKSYTQNVHNLQAGTCHAIFCDEEIPRGDRRRTGSFGSASDTFQFGGLSGYMRCVHVNNV